MKKLFFVLFLFFMSLLLLFSGAACKAAVQALSLWAKQVVPALFPFFVCADMLQRLGGAQCGVPSLFIVSMLSGAPSGARLCAALDCDMQTRTDIAAACNVIGPMFVSGAFCTGMLHNARLALPILLSQYASALIMLSRCRLPANAVVKLKTPSSSVAAAFCESIYGGVTAMLSIGGVILLFRVFLALSGALWSALSLPSPPPVVNVLLAGSLEAVNGCALLCTLPLSARLTAAFAAFFFSFGGVCVMAQSMPFLSLSPLRYLYRKLIQGVIAAFFAFLLTPLFISDAQPVFQRFAADQAAENLLSSFAVFCISAFSVLAVWVFCHAVHSSAHIYPYERHTDSRVEPSRFFSS